MKKSMILLGMLSIGYAYAQSTDPYEGKVGINTEVPSATLNVKTKNDISSPKNLELENQAGNKLVTVLNTGKVGIGTDAPTYKLELVAKDSSYSENSLAIRSFRDGGSSSIDIFRARGTVGAPQAVKKGDYLASWGSAPYDGTRYFSTANIQTVVTGDLVEGQIPTSIIFTVREPNLDTFTPANANTRSIVASIHHSGNVGVGTMQPQEKFHVAGGDNKVRIDNLAGAGDRAVYADANGILKVGAVATDASKIASTTGMECNATNRGKMNFVPNDSGSDIFGICLRNRDGNYYWGYMVGGNNPTNGTGAFGSGL